MDDRKPQTSHLHGSRDRQTYGVENARAQGSENAHEHGGDCHMYGQHVHGETAHTHESEQGHDHTYSHNHSHTHDPKEMKKIVNRLSRSIGHLEAVKRMIEEGQDCADVLIQLAAVRSEINGAGKALLKEHLDHCIVEAVKEHDEESIARMNQAIDQFMK